MSAPTLEAAPVPLAPFNRPAIFEAHPAPIPSKAGIHRLIHATLPPIDATENPKWLSEENTICPDWISKDSWTYAVKLMRR